MVCLLTKLNHFRLPKLFYAESGVSIQVEMMFSSTFYVKCLSVCAVEVKKMLNIIHAFYAGGH